MLLNNNELNRIFDNILYGSPNRVWVSSIEKQSNDGDLSYEINETKDGAYLFFEAPGFNKTNLQVEMENGVIYINGKRTYKLNSEEKVKTIKKEFRIGDGYNASSIEATIEDGLLTVFVPNYKKQDKKRINLL
jgi:HSP20 family molecular chaperone IbpA